MHFVNYMIDIQMFYEALACSLLFCRLFNMQLAEPVWSNETMA